MVAVTEKGARDLLRVDHVEDHSMSRARMCLWCCFRYFGFFLSGTSIFWGVGKIVFGDFRTMFLSNAAGRTWPTLSADRPAVDGTSRALVPGSR